MHAVFGQISQFLDRLPGGVVRFLLYKSPLPNRSKLTRIGIKQSEAISLLLV
jgi:hypothetical protein